MPSLCSREDLVTSSTGKVPDPHIDSIECIEKGRINIFWTVGAMRVHKEGNGMT